MPNNEQELLRLLYTKPKITLHDAMESLYISESTARRLFDKLEKNGLAIRTHGGIQRLGFSFNSYSFENREQLNIEKKTSIAKKACNLIEDGDIIFCDSGTTIRCLCAELVLFSKKKDMKIHIFTNSLANLEILSPSFQVTLIGGDFRNNRRDCSGYLAEHSMEKLFFNKSFIGADGFIAPDMFTTTDYQTAKIDEIAIKKSGKTFLLADSSKFNQGSHITYVSACELTAIITDSVLPKEIEMEIKMENCDIIYSD